MCYTLTDKEVKIRKERRCWGCGFLKEPGNLMQYVVNVFDGNFGATYWCEVCYAYCCKNAESFYDGIGQYEFRGEFEYNTFRLEYLCQKREILIEKSHGN